MCGRDPPGPLHSTGDSMFIHFSSDSSVNGRGFNASYSRGQTPEAILQHGCVKYVGLRLNNNCTINNNHRPLCFRYTLYLPGCGGLLHVDRGVVSSPHYPQNYMPGLDCSWHVMVTPGFRVSVTFQSPFQIQGYGTACSSGDYLEVMYELRIEVFKNQVHTPMSISICLRKACIGQMMYWSEFVLY